MNLLTLGRTKLVGGRKNWKPCSCLPVSWDFQPHGTASPSYLLWLKSLRAKSRTHKAWEEVQNRYPLSVMLITAEKLVQAIIGSLVK